MASNQLALSDSHRPRKQLCTHNKHYSGVVEMVVSAKLQDQCRIKKAYNQSMRGYPFCTHTHLIHTSLYIQTVLLRGQ